jgi:hypothetical protein
MAPKNIKTAFKNHSNRNDQYKPKSFNFKAKTRNFQKERYVEKAKDLNVLAMKSMKELQAMNDDQLTHQVLTILNDNQKIVNGIPTFSRFDFFKHIISMYKNEVIIILKSVVGAVHMDHLGFHTPKHANVNPASAFLGLMKHLDFTVNEEAKPRIEWPEKAQQMAITAPEPPKELYHTVIPEYKAPLNIPISFQTPSFNPAPPGTSFDFSAI